MTFLIGGEGIVDTTGILLGSGTGIHIPFLIGGGDKAQLYQTAWHRCQPQHSEIVLMRPHIGTPRSLAYIALHVFSQFGAVLHVLVLYKLKHDVALGRIRIEATIILLVVLLLEDDGILTLSHLEVLQDTRLLACPTAAPQGIGLEAPGNVSLGQGVDVDGDKQVGLVIVGNLRTTVEFHELVGLAGIDHLHVRAVLLNQFSESEGELQGQILLTGLGHADGSCVTATVSGIDDQRESLVLRICRCHAEKKRYQDEYYLLIHYIF